MMTPQTNDVSPARVRDFAAQARRAWVLLGGRPRREDEPRRKDDDDDDLPRPNAISTLLPLFRLASPPLPA